MADLSKLSDQQLLELKGANGDLSKLSDGTLLALKDATPVNREAAGTTKGTADAKNFDQGLSQAFGQGATMGFGDELTAAVRAALPGLSNWMMKGPALERDPSLTGDKVSSRKLSDLITGAEPVPATAGPQTVSTAPTFGERYTEELARERAKEKAFADENPLTSGAAHIAGNVATAGLALPLAPAGLTSVGPSLVGNIAKGAALGGGLGAVQGFGEGEGGFGDRMSQALLTGGLGAAGGAAVPVLGAAANRLAQSSVGQAVGRNVVSPVAGKLADLLGGNPARSLSAAAPDGAAGAPSVFADLAQKAQNIPEQAAIGKIATSMQREGVTPERIAAKLQELGPEAVLADVSPQFRSLADNAYTMPGETRTTAENVLKGRAKQSGSILTQALEGSEPPPSAFALRGEGQAFDQNARAVGQQAYGEMGGEKLRVSGEMQKIMSEAPAIGETISQIQADAARTGTKLSPIELVDRVKQQLNKNADAAFLSGKAVNKADVGDLANRFEKAFFAANPKAQEAAAAYRQAKSLPEFFDAGANLLARDGVSESAISKSAPALADLLAGSDPQQALAARTGMVNAGRAQAQESTNSAVALAKRLVDSAPVQSKIGQLTTPEHAADIARRANSVVTFNDTKNQILGNSKTAQRMADALDSGMPDTGNAAFRVTPGGITPRFVEHLKNIPALLIKPNEPVRNAIGRATLNMNPDENRRILALAAELLKQRQAGIPLRTALGASAASEITR